MVTATKWVILVLLVLGVGWDVVVATNQTPGDTISEITLGWSWRWFSWPLTCGVVMGHLFWPVKEIKNKREKLIALWVFGVFAFAVDALYTTTVFPIIPLAVGVLIGHFLWPQKAPKRLHAA